MNILVCGDFCPQDRVLKAFSKGEYLEVFGNTTEVIRSVDYPIVNLECPIVEDEVKGISKAGPHLKGRPYLVDALKQVGFQIVTLANNHFLDYGSEGAMKTFNELDQNKIQYVGAGRNLHEASCPLILEKEDMSIALLNACESEFSIAGTSSPGTAPIDMITLLEQIRELRKKNVNYIVAIFHGGHEHYQLPSPRMKRLYRFLVDMGVDVVVNHHQHCYSGYELYKGAPIFYGLGNFCFDRQSKRNTIWNEGFMLELSFSEKVSFVLHPYYQCNEQGQIVLMEVPDKERFYKRMEKLNRIISDDILLEQEFSIWIKKNLKRYKSYLSPYSNKYFRYLCRLGFLPHNLTKARRNVLYDMIKCESHNDIVSRILRDGY